MLTQFGHITVLVKDYDEALEFYIKKVGFKKLTDNEFTEESISPTPLRWVTVAQ